MHRFKLSMHILHLFIQEIELFLIAASDAMLVPDREARTDLNTWPELVYFY